MREQPDCQDLQKYSNEGRRDCCNQGKKKSDAKVCEDGIKKTKRPERMCRSEKISEGSVVRRLLLRVNVKRVKKEGMIME